LQKLHVSQWRAPLKLSTLNSGFLTASVVLIDLPSFHHHFDSKYASAVWSWWCSSEIFQVEFFSIF